MSKESVKPIGIHVREAMKGWTYSMMVEVDDGEGVKYPDCEWTACQGWKTYDEAWDAAQVDAKNHNTTVIGKKKTKQELEKDAKREAEARERMQAMLAKMRSKRNESL